jgi:hypothetical protein
MKNLSKLITIFVITHLLFEASVFTSVQTKELSEHEKEVIDFIKKRWGMKKDDKQKGFFHNIHPDFIGWDYNNTTLIDKNSIKNYRINLEQENKTISVKIEPVGLQITAKMAIVHYFVTIYSGLEDKQRIFRRRNTDIFVKEDGKWLIIGWHGDEILEN